MQSRITMHRPQVAAFPWLLFIATWIIFFGLQQRMDFRSQESEEGVADLVQTARNGDLHHQILTIILGAIGVLLIAWGRKRLQANGVIARLMIAYVGWIALSIVWADDPSVTARREIAFLLILTFAAGCATRLDENMMAKFIGGIVALNVIPAVIAELKYGGLQPFTREYRFGGTVHPNLQGTCLSLGVIVACWLLWQSHGSARLWLVCTSVGLLILTVMTGSRTSMIALSGAGVFSVFLVVARNHRHRLLLLAGAPMLIVGLVGLAQLVSTSGAIQPGAYGGVNALRVERDNGGDVTEFTGRVIIWKACLSYAAERPLLGFGFGGFWSPSRVSAISEELQWPASHCHSAYLEQLLAIGVPGMALYAILLVGAFLVCVKRFFRDQDGYGALAAMLLFMSIHNVTESINVLPTFPNFVFLLITLFLGFAKTAMPFAKVTTRSCVLRRFALPVAAGVALSE